MSGDAGYAYVGGSAGDSPSSSSSGVDEEYGVAAGYGGSDEAACSADYAE